MNGSCRTRGGIEGAGGALGVMSTLPAEHTATESSFGHFCFSTTVPLAKGPGLGSLEDVHGLRVFSRLLAAVELCSG